MKAISKIFALGAVFAASSSLAFADDINGSFAVSGADSFTSSSLTFYNPAQVGHTGSGMPVNSDLTGTFATYLNDGDVVTFYGSPLSFATGASQTVTPPYELFSVSDGTSSETFNFFLTGYSATYFNDGASGSLNTQELIINGSGYFTTLGPTVFGTNVGAFSFTSTDTGGTATTTFSASAGAQSIGTTPEPNSLVLLGTGLIGSAGTLLVRRRRSANVF